MPTPPQIDLLRIGAIAAWNKWRSAEGIDTPRHDLNNANLTGANLTDTNLTGVDLLDSNLSSADLTRADLIDANLTGADLTGAELRDANLTYANLTGANLTDADLFRANLAHADLTGADLTDANLTDADLTGANLPRANLTGADLADAFLHDANLRDANLSGADLTRADLTDANLTHANLTHATLPGVELTGADLTGAGLSGADLTGANLTDANLTRSDFSGANLTYAELSDTDLTEADLRGASLERAKLARANLTRTNLNRANLTGADLNQANLTEADLARANLTDADLTDTRVTLLALSYASSLDRATLGLNHGSGQHHVKPALPESAVAMVSIETPVEAETSPAEILKLTGAVEALSRLAAVVGVSRDRPDAEGGSSVALMSADEVQITLSRLSYGSPFLATLVEYWHVVGGAGGATWAVRDLLKGENSKLYNLFALLTRPSERQAVTSKRDLKNRVEIARLEQTLAEMTDPEPAAIPATIESQWTLEPSSRNELVQRIEVDESIDQSTRAEMIRVLDQLEPLIVRGFSVTITEAVSTPDRGVA